MEIQVLGQLEVRDGRRLLTPVGARQRALLAVLLLNANAVVSADRLLDDIWGDEPPESGRAALHVRMSQLRKALGVVGERVETRASGYLMRVLPGELDLDRFTDLVNESRGCEDPEAADLLRLALTTWQGPPLADLAAEPFARPMISRLEELRLATVERRIELDLSLGRHAELIGELDELVRVYPLREHLRAQLMLALYRAGRQADALALYKATRTLLAAELGLEPAPGLQDLERAILRHDPALQVAVPPASERTIVVAVGAESNRLDGLLSLAQMLGTRPRKDVVIAWPVSHEAALGEATRLLGGRRDELRSAGVVARVAAFVSSMPAVDLVRLTVDQDADLLLVRGPEELGSDEALAAVLRDAPCDVAVMLGDDPREGPVVVPFVGAEHDWASVELGAWIAGSTSARLVLAGTSGNPAAGRRDASRLLASASLAVQRALGIAAEPLLVAAGSEALLGAVQGAGIIVVGMPDRWRVEGLGSVRSALAVSGLPVVLVRRGVRPGGLAADRSLTRFTWSLRGQGPMLS